MIKSRRRFLKKLFLLTLACYFLKPLENEKKYGDSSGFVVVNGWVIPVRDLG